MSQDGSGKTAVVTGATSGIGKAIALRLAKRGTRVLLVARDRGRGEASREEIVARTGNRAVVVIVADLSSQRSIQEGLRQIQAQTRSVHVLVNQAGLVSRERTVTVDGHETMFAVNHLAYYALTLGLRDALARGAGRVLNVTGGIHAAGRIDFDDPMGTRDFGWFKALAQSKLANVLFTYEAARRLGDRGIKVNALDPGGVKTALGENTTGLPRAIMRFGRLFFRDAEDAARGFVTPLLSRDFEYVTGKTFGPDGVTERRTSARSYDEAAAARLWTMSAALTGTAREAAFAA